ncbi:hypothetical protein PCE1_002940 [Barthelona sp. PCE]
MGLFCTFIAVFALFICISAFENLAPKDVYGFELHSTERGRVWSMFGKIVAVDQISFPHSGFKHPCPQHTCFSKSAVFYSYSEDYFYDGITVTTYNSLKYVPVPSLEWKYDDFGTYSCNSCVVVNDITVESLVCGNSSKSYLSFEVIEANISTPYIDETYTQHDGCGFMVSLPIYVPEVFEGFWASYSDLDTEEKGRIFATNTIPISCENGGVVPDGLSTFYCACASGFAGKHCEIEISTHSRPIVAVDKTFPHYETELKLSFDSTTDSFDLLVDTLTYGIPKLPESVFDITVELFDEEDNLLHTLGTMFTRGDLVTIDLNTLSLSRDSLYSVRTYFAKEGHTFFKKERSYYYTFVFKSHNDPLSLRKQASVIQKGMINSNPNYMIKDYSTVSRMFRSRLSYIYSSSLITDLTLKVSHNCETNWFTPTHDNYLYEIFSTETLIHHYKNDIVPSACYYLENNSGVVLTSFYIDDVPAHRDTFIDFLKKSPGHFEFDNHKLPYSMANQLIKMVVPAQTVVMIHRGQFTSTSPFKGRSNFEFMSFSPLKHYVYYSDDAPGYDSQISVYVPKQMIINHITDELYWNSDDNSGFLLIQGKGIPNNLHLIGACTTIHSNSHFHRGATSYSLSSCLTSGTLDGDYTRYLSDRTGYATALSTYSSGNQHAVPLFLKDEGIIPFPSETNTYKCIVFEGYTAGCIFKTTMPDDGGRKILTMSNGLYYDAAVGNNIKINEMRCTSRFISTSYSQEIFDPGVNVTVMICIEYPQQISSISFHDFDPLPGDAINNPLPWVAYRPTTYKMTYASLGNISTSPKLTVGHVLSNKAYLGRITGTRQDGSVLDAYAGALLFDSTANMDRKRLGREGQIAFNSPNMDMPFLNGIDVNMMLYSTQYVDMTLSIEDQTFFCREGDGNVAGSSDCSCNTDKYYGERCEYRLLEAADGQWAFNVSENERMYPTVFHFSKQDLAHLQTAKDVYNASIPLVIKIQRPTVPGYYTSVRFAWVQVSTIRPTSYFDGSFQLSDINDYIAMFNMTSSQGYTRAVEIPFDKDDLYIMIQADWVGTEISLEFACPGDCATGICNRNGTCTNCESPESFCDPLFSITGCPAGYEFVDGSCDPVCNYLPDNSKCIGAGVFGCLIGFEENLDGTLCVEACTLDCHDISGTECVRTNSSYQACVPKTGYQWVDIKDNSLGASPICPFCPKFSSCVAPDVCRCLDDFRLDKITGQCLQNIDLDFTVSAPFQTKVGHMNSFYRRNDILSGVVSATFQKESVPYYKASVLYLKYACDGKKSDILQLGRFNAKGRYPYAFKLSQIGNCQISLVHGIKIIDSYGFVTGFSPDIIIRSLVRRVKSYSISINLNLVEEQSGQALGSSYAEIIDKSYVDGEFDVDVQCLNGTGETWSYVNTSHNFLSIPAVTKELKHFSYCDVLIKHGVETIVDKRVTFITNYTVWMGENNREYISVINGYVQRIPIKKYYYDRDTPLTVEITVPSLVTDRCTVEMRALDCPYVFARRNTDGCNIGNWNAESITFIYNINDVNYVDLSITNCADMGIGTKTIKSTIDLISYPGNRDIASQTSKKLKIYPIISSMNFRNNLMIEFIAPIRRFIPMWQDSAILVKNYYGYHGLSHPGGCTEYLLKQGSSRNWVYFGDRGYSNQFVVIMPYGDFGSFRASTTPQYINVTLSGSSSFGNILNPTFSLPAFCDKRVLTGSDLSSVKFRLDRGLHCNDGDVSGFSYTVKKGATPILTETDFSDLAFDTLTEDDYTFEVVFTDVFGSVHSDSCSFYIRDADFCPTAALSYDKVISNGDKMSLKFTQTSKTSSHFIKEVTSQHFGPTVDIGFTKRAGHSLSSVPITLPVGIYSYNFSVTFKKSENGELCTQTFSNIEFSSIYSDIKIHTAKTALIGTPDKELMISTTIFDPSIAGNDHLSIEWSCSLTNSSGITYANEWCDTTVASIKSNNILVPKTALEQMYDNSDLDITVTVSHIDSGRNTSLTVEIEVYKTVTVGSFDLEVANSIRDVEKIAPYSENILIKAVPRNFEDRLNCTFEVVSIDGPPTESDRYVGFSDDMIKNIETDLWDVYMVLPKFKTNWITKLYPAFKLGASSATVQHIKATRLWSDRFELLNEMILPCSTFEFQATCSIIGSSDTRDFIDKLRFSTHCIDASGEFNATLSNSGNVELSYVPDKPELENSYPPAFLAQSIVPRPRFSFKYGYMHPVTGRKTILKTMDSVRDFITKNALPFTGNVTFFVEITSRDLEISDIQTAVVDFGEAPVATEMDSSDIDSIAVSSSQFKEFCKTKLPVSAQAQQTNHISNYITNTIVRMLERSKYGYDVEFPKMSDLDYKGTPINAGGGDNLLDLTEDDINAMDMDHLLVYVDYVSLMATFDLIGEQSPSNIIENIMPLVGADSSTALLNTVIDTISIALDNFLVSDTTQEKILASFQALELIDTMYVTLESRDFYNSSLFANANTLVKKASAIVMENMIDGIEYVREFTFIKFHSAAAAVTELKSFGDLTPVVAETASPAVSTVLSLISISRKCMDMDIPTSLVSFTDMLTVSTNQGTSELIDIEISAVNIETAVVGSYEKNITASDITVMRFDGETWVPAQCSITYAPFASTVSFTCTETGTFAAFITKSMSCGSTFFGEDCDECVRNHYGEHCEPCPLESPNGICDAGITGTGALVCVSDAYSGELCDTCNSGYYEQGSACITCPPCERGTCLDGAGNGTCQCEQYFTGTLCNMCEFGRTGTDCDECIPKYYSSECIAAGACIHGTLFDGFNGNGSCVCNESYTGADCSETDSGYYGPNAIPCRSCENGGTCDDGTSGSGMCLCPAGYNPGTNCSTCMPGYVGASCELARDCGPGGVVFDGITGNNTCLCATGFNSSAGGVCDVCMNNRFGAACTVCPSCDNGHCSDTASGDGKCICDEYWSGALCDECIPGRRGSDCSLCVEGVIVDSNDECVLCDAGYFGATCEKCPTCVQGSCNDTITGDGVCECNQYWTGTLCDVCEPGREGSNCDQCIQGLVQDSNGDCTLCDAGYFGAKCEKCPACVQGSCNDTITGDGMCLCEEGTTGGLCDQTLPGYRIENNTVIKTCLIDCQGNSFCNESLSDPICVCRAGWSGANCDVPVCNDCAGNCVAPDTCVCSGTFTGASCDECKNGWEGDLCDVPICSSTCVHGTCVAPERCECDADFRGVLCDEAIPKCPVCPANGFCNKDKECQCKHGWTGDECDEQVTLDESNSVFYKRINSFDSEPVLSVIIGNNTYVILDDAEIHRITNNEDEKISEALEGDVVHVFVQEEFVIYHDDVIKVFSFSAKEWEPVSAPSNGAISIAPNSIGIGVVDGILFVGSNHVFMDMPSMNLSTVNITDSPNLGPSAIFDAKSARHSNVVVHADTQLKLYGYLPDNRWVTYDPIDIECPAISVNIFDNDVIIVCPTLNATHAAIVNVSENSHTIEYIQTDTTLLSAGHLTIDDDGLTIVGQHSTTTIGTKPPVEVDPFAVEATAPQTVSGDILVSYDGDLFIVSDIMPYVKRYVEADDRWDEYTMSVTTTATDFIGNCAASRASTTGTTTRIVCVDADQKATLQVLTVDWELSTIYMDSIPIASDVAELSDASLAASETHFFIMGKTAHSSLLFKIDNVFMSTLTVSLKDTVPAAASTIVVDDDIYMFGGKPVTQVMYVVNTRSGVVTKNDVNDAHVAFAGLTGGWKFGSKLATYGTNPVTGTTVGFVIDTETLDVLRLPAELGGVSLDGKVVKSLGPRTGGSALVLLADDMAGTNPSVVEFTFYDVCGVQSSSGSVCNVETGTYVTDPEPEPEEETSYFGFVLIAIFITIFVIGALYLNKKVEQKSTYEVDMFAPNFMEMEPTQSGIPFTEEQRVSF